MADILTKLPVKEPWEIYKGDTFEFEFQITDTDDNPIDITGWSAESEIRKEDDISSDILATATMELDVLNGKIKASFTDVETTAFTFQEGFYDIKVTDHSGKVQRYYKDIVSVYNTVTA